MAEAFRAVDPNKKQGMVYMFLQRDFEGKLPAEHGSD